MKYGSALYDNSKVDKILISTLRFYCTIWAKPSYIRFQHCPEGYVPRFISISKQLTLGALDIYFVGKNVRKSGGYHRMVHQVPSVFTCIDKKEHSQRRRIIGPGFSDHSLKKFEPQLMSHIRKFSSIIECNSNSKEWGPGMQMSDWCSYLTFDIMTDFCFGIQYDLLQKDDFRHIISDIESSNVRSGVLLYIPYLYLGRLDKKLFRTEIESRNRLIQFINRVLKERTSLAKDGSALDMYSYLTRAKDVQSGKVLNAAEIRSESTTLAIAGKI